MDFLFRISVTKQIDNSVQWSVLLSTVEKLLSYYKKIIVTNYFSMLAKGGCNKTVFSLGSVGSADSAVPRFRGSAVPWFHGLQFYRYYPSQEFLADCLCKNFFVEVMYEYMKII